MKRVIATLTVTLAALAAGVGSAVAGNPVEGTPVEASAQSASSDQGALASSDAVQVDPSNQNLSVRVLSPGSDGTVNQTNSDASSANAGNTATTTQNASQSQAAACGCLASPTAMAAQSGDVAGVISGAGGPVPTSGTGTSGPQGATTAQSPSGAPVPAGVQSSDQTASTDQQAAADSSATQVEPSNQNVSVRVLSPGDGGSVSQTNSAASSANAGNTATTSQTDSQSQAGSGVQSSDQKAGTDQTAAAQSEAKQIEPSNSNLSVRVLSPGNDGNVSQTNSAASSANAGNTATTTQGATQNQGTSCGCDGKSGSGVQSSDQKAGTDQTAAAQSEAKQIEPSNSNLSVRVLSPGNDGNVSQTNSAASSANAGNTATTTQGATQNQGKSCGCDGKSGSGVQSSDQKAGTDQTAVGLSEAKQIGADNQNDPVRIWSPGNDGNVSQTNSVASSANAGNTATTSQTDSQSQAGSGVQSSDQKAGTDQTAAAQSEAKQIEPSNSNLSVRVLSPGNDGNVSQTNSVASSANAGNTATTTQGATQNQGTSCGCDGKSGSGVQSSDQKAGTDQTAVGLSEAKQIEASNSNLSVRVLSPGNDGNVSQTNSAASSANAGNTATTTQGATQNQGASCGCGGTGVQASGQWAETEQAALAGSKAEQFGATNDNEPIRIASMGGGGSVSQTNSAASSANAGNTATTSQTSSQDPSGQRCGCSCGCSPSTDVQAAGQWSETSQLAVGLSEAKQIGADNQNDPVRIWSPGNDGNVSQTNSAASSANAGNTATTTQGATQNQGASCGCGGTGVQASGQWAETDQAALAASAAIQLPGRSRCGCEPSFGNSAGPVRIWSPGEDGVLTQSNSAASSANVGNTATTMQSAPQVQGSGCGCSGLTVQALGQLASTHQLAAGLSLALQASPTNEVEPVRVGSWGGGGGPTSQSNSSASSASGGNTARTAQTGGLMMV